MQRKSKKDNKYIVAATNSIKKAGSLRELYIKVHGVNPTRNQLQAFTNGLNPARANPGADVLGLYIEKLPQLHKKTLKDFFDLSEEEIEQNK